ncbi:hypothetical protein FEM48_Zijuj06G0083900 [Ziziphus jujuba var. spinosa]|uniref:Uncharacterized protein n=1 Tax=Ziziphus jujuba var. spinosa TaxID=714518 RepID=A0A978V872_ZIZJJ|nr:hypothetical protein FEM48_Zijuj06G0083900 [Ziziphus jujuba var. spinosa]
MSGRTFVVIFVFWAFLTIITPTLVLLSETSKPLLDLNGEAGEGTKTRRMMGHKDKPPIRSPTAHPAPIGAPSPSPSPSPALAPAPKPTPNRSMGSRKAYVVKLFSESMRAMVKKRLKFKLI